MIVRVGVAYGSDTDVRHGILFLMVVKANERVLGYTRGPQVLFPRFWGQFARFRGSGCFLKSFEDRFPVISRRYIRISTRRWRKPVSPFRSRSAIFTLYRGRLKQRQVNLSGLILGQDSAHIAPGIGQNQWIHNSPE